MLHALLKERGLPPLTDKKNMLALLSEEYGTLPRLPDEITFGSLHKVSYGRLQLYLLLYRFAIFRELHQLI